MRQWMVLFYKEILEMSRNFKWIWLPGAFILLGMTDPLTTYFMPKILEAVGGLPEGTTFTMPVPSGAEVLLMTMSQLNMIGVLIIVLAFMGMISSVIKSGVASMILVKPIPYVSYVTAKWAALNLIGIISLFLGYLAGWYYGSILFDAIPFILFLQSYLIFACWFVFILTMTIFFNTIFRLPGLVAFSKLSTVIVLSVLTNTFEKWMMWSPAQLIGNVGSLLMEGELLGQVWITVIVTIQWLEGQKNTWKDWASGSIHIRHAIHPAITAALLDRLTHHSHILLFDGDSHRFRERLTQDE